MQTPMRTLSACVALALAVGFSATLQAQQAKPQAPTAVAAAPLDLDTPLTTLQARSLLSKIGFGATPASLQATQGMTARQYIERAIAGKSDLPSTVNQAIAQMQISQPLLSMWEQYGPRGSEREKANQAAAKVARENAMLVAKNQAEQDTLVQSASMQNEIGVMPPGAERRIRNEQNRQFETTNAAQLRRDALTDIRRIENLSVTQASQARLLRMANSDNQGREALLHFWLNHFSIFGQKNQVRLMAWDYAQTLEQAMAADSFEALLRASFYHPAMQQYLDNERSIAPSSQFAQQQMQRGRRDIGINENLAREVLELHTMGVNAGYTQQDVQEFARIITGFGVWTNGMDKEQLARQKVVQKDFLLFDPRRHDFGSKTLLGKTFTANAQDPIKEVDAALSLIAQHPITAKRISTKLAQRFLDDAPQETTINAMTQAWLQSKGKISQVMLALVASPQFAYTLQAPKKFKEPVDYVLSVARAACGDSTIGNARVLMSNASDMGQIPFGRVTPDGYSAQEQDWLSPAAMAKRVRFAINVANDRAPLVAAPPEAGDQMSMSPNRPPNVNAPINARGQSCSAKPDIVQAMVGPLSTQTQANLRELKPAEQMAVLLASPEFMRR